MIRTAGGTFDATDRHCYFMAGSPADLPRKYHLTAVNEATTESETQLAIEKPIERGSKLFLDSGVFNLTNQHMKRVGCTMDEALAMAPEQIDGFDELFARYVELVKRYESGLWGYIELDQGGLENKRRTRARLHDLGLNPIPVYHPLNDGWDYFDELAEQYDRICFGNIVQATAPVRIRLLLTMWERRRRYPHLWVHILGLTVNEVLAAIPADSCDSSKWCGGVRWGQSMLASAYLNRSAVGSLSQGLVYNQDVGRFEPGGWFEGIAIWADAFDMFSDVWKQIAADRTELGFDPWPAPVEGEDDPRPAAHTHSGQAA